MYADDTTIYFNLEEFDHENVYNEINSELTKIIMWLHINKLCVTIDETDWAQHINIVQVIGIF